MPKRKKLSRFAITEVSGVSRPAQENARVALFKSADVIDKAAPMTSEASGHRHEILITGNGQTGLSLALGEHTGDDGEAHTHPVVRVRGGWQIGMAAGHSHTLPALNAIIARLLESDPGSEGEADEVGKAGKAGGLVYKLSEGLTSLVSGHQHGIRLRIYEGNMRLRLEHAQAEGQADYHDHAVVRGADGGFVVAVNAGHSHEIDREQLLASALGKAENGEGEAEANSDPRQQEILKMLKASTAAAEAEREQKERKEKMTDAISKRQKAADSLDALAKRCEDALNLTPEAAMAKVLMTEQGAALYTASVTPDAVVKAADPLADFVAVEVQKRLAKSGLGEFASAQEVAAKRRELSAEVEGSPEFARKYAEVYAPPVAPPDPGFDPVDPMGLRKSAETYQGCVTRLTGERAMHKNMSRAQAYADMCRDEQLMPLLNKAYEESLAASQAASVAMTNGRA